MKIFYKNTLLFARLLLPALMCTLLFIFFETDIGYHVLFFSFIIIIFNYDKVKHSFLISNILSILLSYTTFFFSIALYFGLGYIIMQFIELDKLDDIYIIGYNSKQLLFMLPVAIISPILMFISYQILFAIKINNYIKIIKVISIISLVLFGILRQNFKDEYSSIIWQLVMAFALQLILYQKEIVELINGNNTAYNNGYKQLGRK